MYSLAVYIDFKHFDMLSSAHPDPILASPSTKISLSGIVVSSGTELTK